MGEGRVHAILGVGFLLLVRSLLAINDSGGERGVADHNVVYLNDFSDIVIPKDSDNIVLVDNRTSDSVHNSHSDKNISDKADNHVIVADVDQTEVPTSTIDVDVSRTTNGAESSDERPSTATTLAVTPEGEEDEVTTSDDVTASDTDETVTTDVTEGLTTVTDVTNEDDVGMITDSTSGDNTDVFQEVSTLDATANTLNLNSATESDGCIILEDECTLNSTESLELNYLDNSDASASSYSVLETSQQSNEDSGNLETTTFYGDMETDTQLPDSQLPVDSSDTNLLLSEGTEEYTPESQDTTVDTEFDIDYVTSASDGDDEMSLGMVTDDDKSDVTESDDDDEYVLVMETLISTATVYYNDEFLQHLETARRVERTVSEDLFDDYSIEDANQPSHRVERTVSQDSFATYSDYDTNQYNALQSEEPTSAKAFMTLNSRSNLERRMNQRKSDPDPDIDDIIKGIVQLLGGNVKVTAAEEVNTRLTTFGNDHMSSRINNRGPPRLSQVPFGVLNSAVLTRPPIRPPVTPPPNLPNLRPLPGVPPGRPQFVANTRPPFLAPLPPSLASRPVQRPYATGVPLPIDLLPTSEGENPGTSVIQVDPVIPDYETYDEDTTVMEENIPSLESSSGATSNYQSTVTTTPTTEELIIETITTFTTIPAETSVTEVPISASETTELSTQLFAMTSETLIPVMSSTTAVSQSTVIETSVKSQLEPSMLEPTSVLIAPSSVTEEQPQQISTIATFVISSSQVTPSSETSSDSYLSSSATPPLQPQIPSVSSHQPPVFQSSSVWPPTPSLSRPRPGVVIDDPNYRPGQIITGTVVPFDTGSPGDIFDVTVSAYQGFGGSRPVARPPSPSNDNLGQPYIIPVDPHDSNNNNGPLITTPAGGENGYVSIDGRKTYFDLLPTATQSQGLRQDQTVGTGVGIVIPEEEIVQGGHGGFYQVRPQTGQASSRPIPTQPPTPPPTQHSTQPKPLVRKPSFNRRPTQPPIRIDTCIVGDDSTCQEQLNEVCRTEEGVSSCYCKPGTARKRPRTPCKRMISLQVSIKVDRVGDQRIVWGGNYGNPESEEYRLLEWESKLAIKNAMSKTRLNSAFLGSTVHKFYSLGGKVIVNSTIYLENTATTRNRNIPQMLQRQLIQVIQNHANNIGDSALYVDGPLNPIPNVSDLNECNDDTLHNCHPDASCINEFGTFTCQCLPGYTDRYSDDPEQVGRKCESCSSDYCTKRGDCRIEHGQKVCECLGSYYGTRCEIDGEVLGVAVGASVAAVVIIVLTLIFLCMWSRRWKAQDRKTEVLARGAAAGATLGGYTINMQHKGGTLPHNQYGVSMEDRMRWAQIAETMSNQNIYAPQLQDHGGSAVYTANSNEYLTSAATSNPFSVYNRVTRALSNSTIGRGRGQGGFLEKLRGILGRPPKANHKNRIPSYMMTQHPTLNFQQLMALHAQLSAQPEQLRGTMAGPSAAPTIVANTPTPLFKNQRQMAASSSGYASLGTMGSTATGQFSNQMPQQFGLQHLNPVNHLASMQQQQQQQQQYQKQQAFGAQSTYSQYGPASFTAMSQSGMGGVSRAPTLGARTPIPLHESMGGAATIGPMGGASVAATSMGTTMQMMESSEEEMDRPYQLPRPKSRGSLADGSDIYYEPDDLTSTYGPPDRPPPPIPKTSHPQTYNFAFLH